MFKTANEPTRKGIMKATKKTTVLQLLLSVEERKLSARRREFQKNIGKYRYYHMICGPCILISPTPEEFEAGKNLGDLFIQVESADRKGSTVETYNSEYHRKLRASLSEKGLPNERIYKPSHSLLQKAKP